MTKTTTTIAGLAAALSAAAVIYLAIPNGTPPPADICTGQYFLMRACDTTWFAAWPGGPLPAGHHYQGCSAHTWVVIGEDGRPYPIKDQGSPLGTYRRAPDSAPSAQAAHDQCYLPPHNFQGGSSYHCAEAIKPPGVLSYAMKTLAQVPLPMRASFAAQFGCGVPITPAPPTPGPVPTNPCAPCPCWTPGITAPPARTPTRPPAPNPTRTYPHARSRVRGLEFVDVS